MDNDIDRTVIEVEGQRMRLANSVDDPCCSVESNVLVNPADDVFHHGAYWLSCRVCGKSLGMVNGKICIVV